MCSIPDDDEWYDLEDDTHEYDPDCKYCTNNKFVKDAHDAASKFENVSEKANILLELIKELEEKINFINPQDVKARIEKGSTPFSIKFVII